MSEYAGLGLFVLLGSAAVLGFLVLTTVLGPKRLTGWDTPSTLGPPFA